MKRFFTSESVTEGHPDKLCDQISDGILDSILSQDPLARVACETTATTGMVTVFGEITCDCYADIPHVARDIIKDIGYTDASYGFDYKTCAVITAIDEQSNDISMGVSRAAEYDSDEFDITGAGDQGMMFGYACRETPQLMPAPIMFSHALCRELAAARKSGRVPFFRPDGKAQVTVEYGPKGEPARIDAVVVSTQHDDIGIDTVREAVMEEVVKKALPAELIDLKTRFYINPTGRFVIGGPQGDSGLTGRKIIVDTYGGRARHGGGAFSGKDPTKVDRSGAYMARYAAKNLVASGLCDRCELEIAYAIGVANPVSVIVDSFGTGVFDDDRLSDIVRKTFDFRPAAIISQLGLRKPIYRRLAAYGHMGRDQSEEPWEKTDRTDILKSYLK